MKRNPGKGAFKRCVESVAARGGAYDPRAVCASAGRRKYGAAQFKRMAAAGRRRALSNPGEIELDSAEAVRQYKRLIEMEGAKNIRVTRRGRKHVVRWNGLFDFLGKKTTVRTVKTGRKETSTSRHKGYTIYRASDGGFTVPDLDSSVFDSSRDAKRFIDSWVKNNPRKRRPTRKSIPKKVLAGHKRIWGGTIPPGAMEALRREYVGRTNAGRDSKRKTKKRYKKAGVKIGFREFPVGSSGRVKQLPVLDNRARYRQNTVEAAREKYEEFHGRPSEELIEVDTPIHVHDVLSGLGTLYKLVIISPNKHWRVTVKGFKGTLLAQNEDSDKMPQLYLEGGDQSVDLADFGLGEPIHEFEELGRLEWCYYHTVKDHLGDDGGDAVYKHKLGRIRGGARGREKPVVIYDVRNKLITIAGGAYTILPEGIEN